MGDIAIRLEALGKQFRIGGTQARYGTLRDTLTDALISPFRRARKLFRGSDIGAGERDDTIWALRGVSLEIKRGELVGLIGRNGSGKSTLLKILSRIVVPTEGYAEIHGRVGSLLEVGTGFHHELTGRENIALNGAILGMRRAEINRKFDEIVDFAEIAKFLDTPVKHYSTGMYLRLAFAVAAHLEPEILLVDEVLAVGDARFQKKCLAKMQEVGQQSRTVVFVSHNMPAVQQLCPRSILLDEGRVVRDGTSHQVVSAYLNSDSGRRAEREWAVPTTAPGGKVARLRAVRVRGENGRVVDAVDVREAVSLEMEYEVLKGGYVISPWYGVFNEEGVQVLETADCDPAWLRCPRSEGRYVSTARLPGNFLAEGTLFIGVGLATMAPIVYEFEESAVVAFEVIDMRNGDTARGHWPGRWPGVVRPLLEWNTKFQPSTSKASIGSGLTTGD